MDVKFYKCMHCGNIAVKVFDAGVPLVCCGEKMELCPEFNEEILEGEVKCHGRIRPVSLVIFAVKSFLNKQFFSMVKQFKVLLKGE